ncbi:MAG: hypothetical protein ABIH82_00495 [Candidatus Woesearchaeota archaeon]
MKKQLNSIEDFESYLKGLLDTKNKGFHGIRLLLSSFWNTQNFSNLEVARIKAEVNDFTLWVKSIFKSYISKITGEFPDFPSHYLSLFDEILLNLDILRKKARKLTLNNAMARVSPKDYIKSVSASLDIILNQTEDKIRELLQELIAWESVQAA